MAIAAAEKLPSKWSCGGNPSRAWSRSLITSTGTKTRHAAAWQVKATRQAAALHLHPLVLLPHLVSARRSPQPQFLASAATFPHGTHDTTFKRPIPIKHGLQESGLLALGLLLRFTKGTSTPYEPWSAVLFEPWRWGCTWPHARNEWATTRTTHMTVARVTLKLWGAQTRRAKFESLWKIAPDPSMRGVVFSAPQIQSFSEMCARESEQERASHIPTFNYSPSPATYT